MHMYSLYLCKKYTSGYKNVKTRIKALKHSFSLCFTFIAQCRWFHKESEKNAYTLDWNERNVSTAFFGLNTENHKKKSIS